MMHGKHKMGGKMMSDKEMKKMMKKRGKKKKRKSDMHYEIM
ncbi:MAG: hypothetical protein AAB875_00595 [Patescibacteria group bacterium]